MPRHVNHPLAIGERLLAGRPKRANGRYRYVRGADEGGPFEIANQVAGLKPPQAALVKATLVSGFQVFEDILARSE